MALTVNTFEQTTNEQFATGTNWSGGHAPTTGEQAVIPATKKCELKTAREFGALKVRGKLTVTSAGSVKLAPTEAAPENKLVDLAGAESVTWNAGSEGIKLLGAVATIQTIALGGFPVSRLKVEAAGSGKWELAEDPTLTFTTADAFLHEGTGEFRFGGRKVTCNNVECRENSKADFAGASFKLSGESGVFMLTPTGATYTGLASCTVEVTNTVALSTKQIKGAGKEIGTITVTGFNVFLEELTFGTLNVLNSGCEAGKGCKLKASASFVGSSVTANGTEGAPARLESTVAGTAAKLKLPEQELTTGFLAIKDITIETGVWYVPPAHGSNSGGDSIVKPEASFTIAFEAKPGAGVSRTCGDTIEISDTATRTLAAPRTTGDTIALSDVASRAAALPRAAADTIAVSDAATGQATKARTASDTVTTSDQATRGALTLSRTVTDTVTTSDQAARTSTRSRTAADTVTASDTAIAFRAFPRTAADTITVTDTAARAVTPHARTAGDAVAISDLAARTSTARRTASDTVTLTTAVTFETGHQAEPVSLTLTANSTATLSLTPASTETVTLTNRST